MDFLSSLIGSMTSAGSLASITQQSGAQTDQVTNLINEALPTLLQAMQNNASDQAGAQSLLNALSQHTEEASVEDQIKGADTDDGAKILGHLLGNDSEAVLGELARANGLSGSQTKSILAMLAPVLMSSIFNSAVKPGKTDGIDLSDGLDLNDLLGIALGGGTAKKASLLGILGSLLGGK